MTAFMYSFPLNYKGNGIFSPLQEAMESELLNFKVLYEYVSKTMGSELAGYLAARPSAAF